MRSIESKRIFQNFLKPNTALCSECHTIANVSRNTDTYAWVTKDAFLPPFCPFLFHRSQKGTNQLFLILRMTISHLFVGHPHQLESTKPQNASISHFIHPYMNSQFWVWTPWDSILTSPWFRFSFYIVANYHTVTPLFISFAAFFIYVN